MENIVSKKVNFRDFLVYRLSCFLRLRFSFTATPS